MDINAIKIKARGLAIKHGPTAMVFGGVIGVGATVFMACKATLGLKETLKECKKDHDILAEKKLKIGANISENEETDVFYTEKDYIFDVTKVYGRMGLRMMKLYGPSLAVGLASIAGILGGYGILNKRQTATLAACATFEKGFNEYRQRVIEEFGEDVDKKMRLGLKKIDVEDPVLDKNGEQKLDKEGNPKTKKSSLNVVDDLNGYSMFARFFDETCAEWTGDPTFDLQFLLDIQNKFNDLLKARGFVMLNEVYRTLGIKETPAGAVVGWIHDPYKKTGLKSDGYIDFGIHDVFKPNALENRRFVNGYSKTVLLDFNVDGTIVDYIGKL